MNLLFKITDEDVGKKLYPMNNPDTRNAVRVILTNNSGQIALLNKQNFVQTSFIFSAKVLHDTHVLNLTDNEISEGSALCWFEPHEALNKINDCYKKLKPSEYSNIFATKMINRRDYAILKYYLDNVK